MQAASPISFDFNMDFWSAGNSLPPKLAGRLEDFFHADLSSVQLHIGPDPEAFDAIAFASGEHVYLTPAHVPDTPTGVNVLVHELTHVLQQRAGMVGNSFGSQVIQHPELEAHADCAAALWSHGVPKFHFPPATSSPVDETSVIQCLTFHGKLPNGSFGIFSAAQIRDWIIDKSPRQMNPANVMQCVNYFQGHTGAGGGGFGNYQHGRNQVYHISHGMMGGNQGCTLFFTCSTPNATVPASGIGAICGIGRHVDNSGPHGAPRYTLDWTKSVWVTGNLFSP